MNLKLVLINFQALTATRHDVAVKRRGIFLYGGIIYLGVFIYMGVPYRPLLAPIWLLLALLAPAWCAGSATHITADFLLFLPQLFHVRRPAERPPTGA